MTTQRYTLDFSCNIPSMDADPDGGYVLWTDYAALEARELDMRKQAADLMEAAENTQDDLERDVRDLIADCDRYRATVVELESERDRYRETLRFIAGYHSSHPVATYMSKFAKAALAQEKP